MKFSAPWWLWGMAAIAVLLVLGWRLHDRRQRAALARFVAPRWVAQLTQSVSQPRRTLQRAFFLLSVLALCAALAGPLLGFQWQILNRRGDQIIFALDTSRSMLTPDLKPNRLVRAKLAIDDLARRLDGNVMGIVAFAGTAFLACPLTFDVGAFRESLGAIDTHTIPHGGTDVAAAIQAAQSAFARHPGSSKILVLVTDGEDLEGGAMSAAQAAAQQGIRIFTLGVGSTGGDLIPLPAEEGGGFVKDDTGAFVRSHLDEKALKDLAAAAGGIYVGLAEAGDEVDAPLERALQALAKQDLASRQQRIYTERFQWPLCAALGALLFSLLIGVRRRRPAAPPGPATLAAAALVLLSSLPFRAMHAADTADSGEDPVRTFNGGTVDYHAGRYKQAGEAFERSIRQAPSNNARRLADQEDAYYDLGNSLYRAGQASQSASPDETRKAWAAAVKAYDTALQMRPGDADSRFNRDLVKKKLEELDQPPPPQGGGGGGGKPPPGQPPSGQPPQGQPPQGQPSPGQPPPGQPPPGQPPPGQSPPGSPPPDAAAQQPPSAPAAQGNATDRSASAEPAERVPGQMSSAEAQQLLDSAKSDEKHGAPPADMDGYRPPPDKPFRNW